MKEVGLLLYLIPKIMVTCLLILKKTYPWLMTDMFAVSYSYIVFAGSNAMAVPGQAVKYPVVLVIQKLSAVEVPVVPLALFSSLKPLQSLIK